MRTAGRIHQHLIGIEGQLNNIKKNLRYIENTRKHGDPDAIVSAIEDDQYHLQALEHVKFAQGGLKQVTRLQDDYTNHDLDAIDNDYNELFGKAGLPILRRMSVADRAELEKVLQDFAQKQGIYNSMNVWDY